MAICFSYQKTSKKSFFQVNLWQEGIVEKFYSLINSPLDAFIALVCAALLSIFGAFIKDWILKLFSLFSSKFKKRRITNSKRMHRQARLLLREPVFLSLYIFRALKMSLLWVISNITGILIAVFLQQKTELLINEYNLDINSRTTLELFDPNVFPLVIMMILMIIIFILSILSGFKSVTRSRILYKAFKIRARHLSADLKLP
jgi:hypothetical protein